MCHTSATRIPTHSLCVSLGCVHSVVCSPNIDVLYFMSFVLQVSRVLPQDVRGLLRLALDEIDRAQGRDRFADADVSFMHRSPAKRGNLR
jgi:hypothetical protein